MKAILVELMDWAEHVAAAILMIVFVVVAIDFATAISASLAGH